MSSTISFATTETKAELASSDGRVDLADPIRTIDQLFFAAPIPCPLSVDANDDDRVDIGDPIWLLNFLFRGSNPPPPPYPGPGQDTLTPGRLDCPI